jgi:hypothetical protein
LTIERIIRVYFLRLLALLSTYHVAMARLRMWDSLFLRRSRWPELVQCLLEDHYDASYAHGWADTRSPLATIELEGDSEDQMDAFIRAALAISPKALRPEVAAKETGVASDLAR